MVKILGLSSLQQQLKNRRSIYRDLIRAEARIGGKLFGEVAANRHREFFCLDERTWVWHEEWYDQAGRLQTRTTRYEVQLDRVLKVQGGQYFRLDDGELRNFLKATNLYYKKVNAELYAPVN